MRSINWSKLNTNHIQSNPMKWNCRVVLLRYTSDRQLPANQRQCCRLPTVSQIIIKTRPNQLECPAIQWIQLNGKQFNWLNGQSSFSFELHPVCLTVSSFADVLTLPQKQSAHKRQPHTWGMLFTPPLSVNPSYTFPHTQTRKQPPNTDVGMSVFSSSRWTLSFKLHFSSTRFWTHHVSGRYSVLPVNNLSSVCAYISFWNCLW